MEIKTIGVVGAGTMGSGIAQVFAQAGLSVCLVDVAEPMLDRARTAIDRSLSKFVGKGALTPAARDQALSRLQTASSVDGLATADFIVEAILEDASAKRELFAGLNAIARTDVVLASNTSSISITVLGAASGRADRVLGMHFMNPVPIMGLVELVRGQATSDASMKTASELCAILGKTAVESADYPGFISNRILMPMLNEAFFAVMEGVGTPEAIDTVMKLGMNHPMGPLTLADFIGLDVCLGVMEVLYEGFGQAHFAPPKVLRDLVAAGDLGQKTGRGFHRYPRD
jgi:3-hydroxybutyryl-CoA dehydrogenase